MTRYIRKMRAVALCAALSATALIGARAQDMTTGSISGTITDSTGAAVKGATVKLINKTRGALIRTVRTNGSGYYTATDLPLGSYTVEVADQGFATVDVTGVVLNVNDALNISRTLAPGSTSETVTVEANPVQLNLQDPTAATLIDSTQINDLVMVTRNYESLVNLQPGVAFSGATDVLQRGPVGVNGASSVVAFSVNGARTTANNWTIDGADNLDRGANLTLYVYPSPDAISEFKTLRGQYSAEFGRNASGQIDVVTKSGTNSLHGSAYEYFRNDYLDANGYANDQLGLRLAKYRYNDFGFTIGGPVIIPKLYNGKNKTFFFVSENWLREITYANGQQAIVPTAEERKGDFSNDWYQNAQGAWVQGPVNVCSAFTNNPATQTNTCTAAGTQVTNISPTAQAYLKDLYSVIPVPNEQYDVAHGLDPHSILSNIPNRYPNLDSVVRVDQQVGQKLSLMYRFIHDTFPDFIGSGTFVSVPIPGLSATLSNNPGTQHLGKATWTVSPSMVANFGYAYSNGSIYTRPEGALLASSSPDVKPPLPYTSTVNLIPTLNFSSLLSTLGGGAVYIDHGINHEPFADITKTFHNHTLVAGVSYNHYEKTENTGAGNNQGTFGFTGDLIYATCVTPGSVCVTPPSVGQTSAVSEDQAVSNFLTGNANNGFSQLNREPVIDIHQNIYSFFVQDNWKATPRLTLNLGVRYDYNSPFVDDAGYMNNFDPSTYSASKAPTISSNGVICFTSPCSQTGSNAGLPTTANPNADYVGANYLNGLIFANPNAANNNQGSPWGNHTTQTQAINLSPRFGWAFDVFGNGKTAFRGGYGWSYDEVETSWWEYTDWYNPPATTTYSVAGQAAMDDPAGGSAPNSPSKSPGSLYAVPLKIQTPYVQQYSLDLQQALEPTFMLDVGYYGSHGTHLAGLENINQIVPGSWRGVVDPRTANPGCVVPGYSGPAYITSGCVPVLFQIKPYLGYDAINAMRTIFN